MDFRLTEEQRLVQETARDFVDKEIVPHVRDWEAKGEIPKSFYAKMAGLGFLGAPVPEKYGGAGGGFAFFPLPLKGMNPRGFSAPPPDSPPTPPPGSPPLLLGAGGRKKERVSPPPPEGEKG